MGEMMSYLDFALQNPGEKKSESYVKQHNIDKCWSWQWVYTNSLHYFFFLVYCVYLKIFHNEKI